MLSLETERLLLRDFRSGDFEAFYATTQDPEYQKFYSEKESGREFWQSIFDSLLVPLEVKERMKFQLAICLKTGELIGTCGVRIEDCENRQASFGCAIARPYWGKGLAVEAAHRILKYGFSELGMHRIYAETISENARAGMLARRLGMRLEAELRENRFFQGRWWHTAIYAILKDEWEIASRR